jgi:hypothetical protein
MYRFKTILFDIHLFCWCWTVLFLGVCAHGSGQLPESYSGNLPVAATDKIEYERDLECVPVPSYLQSSSRKMDGFASESGAARGGSLTLPFFDDFSTPSLPNANGVGFELYHRWVDSSARLTQTYALNPPTIGVATLDGLDATGYPYNFVNVNSPGWCDTLTSMPLALNGYFPESNIHLMFYVQGGGLGNAPEPNQDKLILEFKAVDDVTGDALWTEVWSTDSVSNDSFERYFVPVDQPMHLSNGFQFRFRNYGALGGNVDLWHIDYLLLNDGIDPATFEVASEVAILQPEHTLLRDFTRMPWLHFVENPAFFMRDSLTLFQRNLSATQADNVSTGFSVRYNQEIQNFPNFFQNTNVLPESVFTTGMYIGSNPQGSDFAFDEGVNDSCAVFDVSCWQSSIGLLHTEKEGVMDNDSIVFQQVFANDYAYDDGTAEKAYSLTASGAKLAIRFPIAEPDTLLGLAIHFTPFYNNADLETFLLRAWTDSAGFPAEEMGENFQFQTPQYFTEGYDLFAFYEYDQPIPVDGIIHVGLIQANDALLNFGLDKNTNANIGEVHYQLGLGGAWISSEIQGTVMIRPVLRAGKTETWTSVSEWSDRTKDMVVYPNPSERGEITVSVEERGDWTCWNGRGRMIAQGQWATAGLHVISTADWSPGVYVLRHSEGFSARVLIQ